MPPKKFIGKLNYEERRLQDDFIEKFPLSKEGRDAVEGWKVLKSEVWPSLKDKYGNFGDTNMPTKGLDFFRWWHG